MSERSQLWKKLKSMTTNKPRIKWCTSNASQIQSEINKINHKHDNKIQTKVELEKEITEWEKIGQMGFDDEIKEQVEIYYIIMARIEHETINQKNKICHTITTKHENQDNCPICLECMENNCIILPCIHKFHDTCIKKLFITFHNNKCPICRTKYTYQRLGYKNK